ncbi:hypothetical protein [Nocardiopsis ansamitocini]|uniref:Uncharacterized protein n=1 Tax=Nocardiopsis ansamitocini TaxID=1670832 RepID=A0A9W6UJ23_9ACTN|nr:hypothetical protein [Nocardiopsis ansamitocini]GLU47615.1 hypothetical protein Nans01_19660 [Nocardiopsis ansamitocini]
MTQSAQPGDRVTVVIASDELSAVVTIEGRPQTVRGEGAKETRRIALDLAAGYATHIGRPVLIEARDDFGVLRLEAAPGGVVRGLTETSPLPQPKPKPARSGKGGAKVALAVIGGLVAIGLVAVGVVVVIGLLPGQTVAQDGGEGPVLLDGRSPPAGFASTADWRIPLAPGTRPAVAPDGGSAAIITLDERLALVDGSGEQSWSGELPLPVSEIKGLLRFGEGPDGPRVVVVGPSSFWLWPTGGGDPVEYPLASGAQVTFGGSAPLVTTDDGVLLPQDDELVEVDVPEGAGAMLAHGSEVLMAAVGARWFWVPGEGASTEVEADAPEGAEDEGRMLTASENYVVVRWKDPAADRVLLGFHDPRDGSVVASASIAVEELADAHLIEGAGVAAYGSVLLDPDSRETRVLSGFKPLSAAGDVLYGELDGEQVAVGADALPEEMEPNAARPWGLLDGRAVVVDGNNGLYALPPD